MSLSYLPFTLNQSKCLTAHDALREAPLRKTLVCWLHAVGANPSIRLTADESWRSNGASDAELAHWLHAIGVEDCAVLLDIELEPAKALDVLLAIADTVRGRVLIGEQGGEEASMSDTLQLMQDLAANQESVFDDRCEIFPLSIQLLTKDRTGSGNRSKGATKPNFAEQLAALEQVCSLSLSFNLDGVLLTLGLVSNETRLASASRQPERGWKHWVYLHLWTMHQRPQTPR
ncbi:hypothetical protein BBJ28_00010313 [Nothophytophthora sp. Chile5]|nr:hypothetical protein BBJ28_00010313 [Nothophytophthora sp. Chile5]